MTSQSATGARSGLGPPGSLWLATGLVALLRALPWLACLAAAPSTPEGVVSPIGYNQKDTLQYVAFIREAAVTGDWFLANPFTTSPQDGRYLLVLLDVLGQVARVSGLSPFTVLELSRIPLLFLFLVAFWRTSGVVLGDDRPARVAACWLVLLAGGVEAAVETATRLVALPAQVDWQVKQDLWHLQGWNTFSAFYNPLWVAALAVTLVGITPLLRAGGPRTGRDAAAIGLSFVALACMHPYSAIVVAAVAVTLPVVGWLFRSPPDRRSLLVTAAGLGPAVLAVASLSVWQCRDAVYRATSGHVLGPQALSPAWYPVTLGAVGFLAIRGWQGWVRTSHPTRLGVGAWTLTVMALHSSTVLNGYHFVFHLFPAVCLAAAPAFTEVTSSLRSRPNGRALVLLLLAVCFQTPVTATVRQVPEARARRIRTSGAQVLEALASLPPGNVLAPADLGNHIPAYTSNRVYVGHWFLTPQYDARAAEALDIANGQLPDGFEKLLDDQHISYLVTTRRAALDIQNRLGARVQETVDRRDLSLMILRREAP